MPMSTKAICAQLVEVLGMVIKTCGRLVIIMNDRQNHLSTVDTYLASLPKGSSPSTIHSKKLAFMADNDIRQLGKPRIGTELNLTPCTVRSTPGSKFWI